ncbi:LOW QUALITY PROTEIN: surfeit locus protein 6 homolog [Atheta coriaria]|uniref:LOW QUALITY PROTEIN: surfeit locus protein 6 homolog n=1 Tax=Dalotia coriaria TaxID=877792 RepID=UPI0031F4161D
MQLSKEEIPAEQPFKSIEASLLAANKYITQLFSIIAFPDRCAEEEFEDEEDEEDGVPRKKPNLQGTKTSRATSISELQQRLEAIQSKKKQTFKEKLKKKDLKNQVKRKSKREERNAQKKQLRAQKLLETKQEQPVSDNVEVKASTKPIFNSEGKMVFSKFDFSGLGKTKNDKNEKDPKKILENLHKQKEKLQKLEAEGEVEKAKMIKDKTAWKNAIAKAEGEKIKDDEVLLKKSLKKNEQMKKASKKKWDKRIEGVKHAKDERQKKRQENIDKRKKTKKTNKLKKAAKKGKIIPGF